MKKYLLIALIVFPLVSSASIPNFPMSFFGSATINDIAVSEGTKIRAYYGTVDQYNLVGEITVKESGVYGYALSTGQKLLIKEGEGRIIFTFQSPVILNNQETLGINEVFYTNFESGVTKVLNMEFVYEVAPPSLPPPSNGGGGGGGGRRTVPALPSQASNVAQDNVARSGSVLGASIFKFSRNLSFGLSGLDVTELQNRLVLEGLYNGPITGYFGPLTLEGVKAFQLKYAISQTGIVGPLTQAKLNQGSGAVLGVQNLITIEQLEALIFQLQTQLAELLLQQNFSPR